MAYLSELLGREVRDVKGALIGKLEDVLIVPETNHDPHPRIVALAVKRNGGEPALVPWGAPKTLPATKSSCSVPPQRRTPQAETRSS
jgi:sporulation protein YlmC with PRC-barrel domain